MNLPGALDVMRAAMLQDPNDELVVERGQAVLDAVKQAQAAAVEGTPSPTVSALSRPAGVDAVHPGLVRSPFSPSLNVFFFRPCVHVDFKHRFCWIAS